MGPFDGALPPPSAKPEELTFTLHELGAVRRFVLQGATEALLDAGRAHDLVLAVNELATNSVRHGGGSGTLRMWAEPDVLVCEVLDGGHITAAHLEQAPPPPEQHSGRGLWVVNRLCDAVQIRSTPTGSVVRVHMRLS
ncbi:MAG TPA: ATP-binding protein [Solirubrobacteraceae bacterium]|jgi:anti-sigma regulatory factor (Ser/Thr protein kinase)|nr:ATP-binding protein [Solirubrobacteraceae bacterium]